MEDHQRVVRPSKSHDGVDLTFADLRPVMLLELAVVIVNDFMKLSHNIFRFFVDKMSAAQNSIRQYFLIFRFRAAKLKSTIIRICDQEWCGGGDFGPNLLVNINWLTDSIQYLETDETVS